jgi:hypothetical protein
VLTHAERAAGRAWRSGQDAALHNLNAVLPVNEHPLPYVRHIRHLCPGAGGRSVSFDYAEIYVTSPALEPDIPAGRFAYVYREGRCALCEHTARSLTGRVVDGITRLPSGRKVVQG